MTELAPKQASVDGRATKNMACFTNRAKFYPHPFTVTMFATTAVYQQKSATEAGAIYLSKANSGANPLFINKLHLHLEACLTNKT